jgi:hypothetical protein
MWLVAVAASRSPNKLVAASLKFGLQTSSWSLLEERDERGRRLPHR